VSAALIALKLLLVPTFLLALSLAGRRWGPSVAGWLAGLPAVGGPILFFLAYERGAQFAATAACAALAAVFPIICFCVAYAHAAQRLAWTLAYLCALLAWLAGAFAVAQTPAMPLAALAIALAALFVAPRLFPRAAVKVSNVVTGPEIACRMLAGAALTLGVTAAAGALGDVWSGLLGVYPLLATVLAGFSHARHGGGQAAALLRAMATGLYSFAAFCFVLALTIERAGIALAFAAATAAALGVQAATRTALLRLRGEMSRAR
jgi:hypothetical protein